MWFSMMAALAAQPQTAISARAAATNPGVPSSAGGTCSSSGIAIGGITPLRIASVFIVLASSTVGILLPFIPEIASRNTTLGKKTKIFYEELFFTLKHVGTGVIIATAFVHLSYEAMVDLESPCLNLSYKPLSPVLSMCSLGLIFLVDCWMTRYLHRLKKTNNARPSEEHTRAHGEDLVHTEHRHQLTHHGKTSKPEANHHKSHEKAQEKRHLRVFPISSSHRKLENTMQRGEDSIEDVNSRLADRSKEIEVYIIEGGIVFHSVMVGVGAGTSSDNGFVPYIIAITFHQFFDGCAIGTRMAELNFVNKRMKQLVMLVAYVLVTPLSIALGLGVRSTFKANDPATILTIGSLNSLSAGVLLYGALTDLLAKDFLSGPMLDVSTGRLSVALVSVLVGAFVMSLREFLMKTFDDDS